MAPAEIKGHVRTALENHGPLDVLELWPRIKCPPRSLKAALREMYEEGEIARERTRIRLAKYEPTEAQQSDESAESAV